MGQYWDPEGNVHWDDEFKGPSSTKWETTSRVAQPLLKSLLYSMVAGGPLTIPGATVGVGMLGHQLIDTMHKRSIRPGISIIEEYSSDNLIDSILDNKNVFGEYFSRGDSDRLFKDALALSQDIYVINNHSPNFYHTYSFTKCKRGWHLINKGFRIDEIGDEDVKHFCREIIDMSHNFNNLKSGLGSMVCVSKFTNNLYVIAYVFEGTYPNLKETQDVGADIEQGLMGKTPQYEQAIHNAKLIVSQFNNNTNLKDKCKLYYFGHSLGGGLANIAALSTGFPSITFNAASVHPDYVSQYKSNLKKRILVGAYVDGELLSSRASKVVGLPKVGDRYKITLTSSEYYTKDLPVDGILNPSHYSPIRKHMLEPLCTKYGLERTSWNKTNEL